MVKVQVAIMLDYDNFELLRQIQQKYHSKTLGHAMEIIIRQWQFFVDERKKQQENNKKISIDRRINPKTIE